MGVEGDPTVPDTVMFFMTSFLFGLIDDLTVCGSCISQEKITVGRAKMMKLWGICEGRWV
jgi:hypothetical protein